MKEKKVILVVGTRPNFMKVAPIIRVMRKYPKHFNLILVHTGQHYDYEMSRIFFENLNLPKPDIYLGVGSASQAVQTAKIMIEFEKVLLREKPNLIIVVGDVNSTLACALTAAKLNIQVGHVEAGLRSFDRSMPEEINRLLTDAISDYLFITEESARINLLKEGKPEEKIYFVGNVMIDTLLNNLEKADRSQILSTLSLKPKDYALLTLHRPSNVDSKESFEGILNALEEIQKSIPIVYPIHPRARRRIREFGLEKRMIGISHLKVIKPLGYLDFLKLMKESKLVMTDSGGMQEEITVLGIPCLTLRRNTERPITVNIGTNVVVGNDPKRIIEEVNKILKGNTKKGRIPDLWDGKAAQKIVRILRKKL